MKRLLRLTSLVFSLVLLVVTGSNANAAESLIGSSAASEDEVYTVEEMLRYALEDERMAQAEYEAIMDVYDVTRPFSNIAQAEVRHEALVIDLYESRNIVVPEFDPSPYIVIPDTLVEIYSIGVEAEIKNIEMYESFLELDLDEDIRGTFEVLRDGSIKHLEAFERALDRTSASRTQNQGRRGRRK